jgi:hypothetical protein
MAKYSASGSQTLTTSATTCLGITSNTSTVQRNWIYELVFGNVGTPADHLSIWTVQRCTAPGAGVAVVGTRLDLADREAQGVTNEDHGAGGGSEPTYTSTEELMEVPLNHRATYRWVAKDGSEIVTPATSGDGIGIHSLHASATTDFRAVVLWEE